MNEKKTVRNCTKLLGEIPTETPWLKQHSFLYGVMDLLDVIFLVRNPEGERYPPRKEEGGVGQACGQATAESQNTGKVGVTVKRLLTIKATLQKATYFQMSTS